MIKLKYVGAKTDGERAFKEKTGIEWFPGDEHEVSNEHAAEMLRHPDVFEATDTQAENTGDPFAGKNDAEVRAYAKANGLKIQGIGVLKGANLRAKVLAALDPKK